MRKGFLLILISNIIRMVFGMLIGFLLPSVLSIDEYAYLKTFQLYVAYIGFLTLGYLDGMYLKYGGKDLDKINRGELNNNISTIRIFQISVAVCVFAIALIKKDIILVAFSLSVLPLNMIAYYKYLYQASGEFVKYSNIMNFNSLITTFFILGTVYLVKSPKSSVYVFTYVIIYIIVYIVLELMFFQFYGSSRLLLFSYSELIGNIKNGIILMLGNFSSGLLSGLDRWFVKLLMMNADFSTYSFAVSIEAIIDTAISPVIITLYNYMCRTKENDKLKKIKSICLLVGLYLISAAYGAKLIIMRYLPHYQASVDVLFLLFAAQVFYFIIRAIYVNCYRARQMQKIYLRQLIAVLAIAAMLNTVFYFLMRQKEAFALGTLVTAFIWMLMCSFKVPELQSKKSETWVLFTSLAVFLACGRFLNPWMGFMVYIAYTTLMLLIFMRPVFRELIGMAFDIVRKRGFSQ